jgi:16S rRNA (adenine1518-N6/adenine1519-N6)-dimethyltransferase
MDVLQFDFQALSASEGRRLTVVGNLPYNISSPLAFHLLESFESIKRAVFMVQNEVGERWVAAPGGKDYGVLSVLFGIFARVAPLFTVGPAQFYPPPKVDSLVLRLDLRDSSPPGAPPFGFLRRLVSVAFQQRRKTLQNCLKGYGGETRGALAEVFEKVGIQPGRRPETLSPMEFLELSKAIYGNRSERHRAASEGE